METEFWHERWRRGETGWHQADINPYLQAHWGAIGAPRAGEVFVPLCGKSRDLLWLTGQGHRVLGVELSDIAVSAFFEDNGLMPTRTPQGPLERWSHGEVIILRGDVFELTAEAVAGVTSVFDRASLIALPPPQRARYVEHFAAILPWHPPTLLITLEYDQSQMHGPPFAVHEEEVRALYEPRYRVEVAAARDVLAESPRFRERGLGWLVERVFVLRAR